MTPDLPTAAVGDDTQRLSITVSGTYSITQARNFNGYIDVATASAMATYQLQLT
ncbi:hypothetical protein OH492_17840 [Vibrio chagasii]|nr:hypothetical protein [Vibrio chagasii]